MGRWWFVVTVMVMVIAMVIAMPAPAGADDGWWVHPIERAALSLDQVHEADRDYSTAARPRDVAGQLALSCENQEGRPCGNGQGASGELDTAAGYGPWVLAAARLRLRTGRDAYSTGFDVDRLHLDATLGIVSLAIGRDVLSIGPQVRAPMGWGPNAPPLDHVQLSTAHPLSLTPWLGLEATYALGRLAAPQTYPHDLVSIARLQLDLADRVELGAMQLLQLGGDGAPGFGVVDFVLEHVRRRDSTASASDSSNRRMGVDVTVRLAGARLVYQLVFEDLRKELISALRYDADHLLGVTTRWLTVSLRKTGERSYEHAPRLTGFTTGGHIVGDPLGPAATAVFARGYLPLSPSLDLYPWLELARLDSDRFAFGDGPITRTASGPSELHVRVGLAARLALGDHIAIEPEAILEDVERYASSPAPGARRLNSVLRATVAWRP